MKFCPQRLGWAQSLVALSVSLAVVLSGQSFAFAVLAKSAANSPAASQKQSDTSQNELRIISATATASAAGVMLEWRTNSATDNLGFNVYRVKAGQRTRVNKEIIPGAVFNSSGPAEMRGGGSYAWFDRGGTPDATYYIESVSQRGSAKTYEQPISPVISKTASGFEQTPDALSGAATESTDSFEKYYPAAESSINSPQGALEDQWAIAAQTALKIAIKKDGWYRVTQLQMVAAGFNPTVDIRNLRLFVAAQEVAISTSQHSGPFAGGDYIEFYGRGLDKPTTDSRIYYLIAGTVPGKRVRGEIQLDDDPILPPSPSPTPAPPPSPSPTPAPPPSPSPTPAPPPSPSPTPAPPPPSPTPGPPPSPSPSISPIEPAGPPAPQVSPATTRTPVLQDPIFFSWPQQDLNQLAESLKPRTGKGQSARTQEQSAGAVGRSNASADVVNDSFVEPDAAPERNVTAADESSKRATPRNEMVAAKPSSDKNSATLPVATKPKARATSVPRPAAAAGRMRGAGKFRKRSVSKKRKKSKLRRQSKQERNHAVLSTAASEAASAPPNFTSTVERKDRTVYFLNCLNGDAENWFGLVNSPFSSPASETINTPNPDLAATGTAQLEIALQGANQFNHQVNVEFNGVPVGSFSFFGLEYDVQVFNIPASQLQDSALQCGSVACSNTIRFTVTGNPDTTIVDYVKISYPHLFRADAGAARFDLRGTQSGQVDGFATASVRLIDYTDHLNVSITKPASEPSGSGFAITVPTSDPPSKPSRLFYAIPEGQFDTPAGLSLSQPSTLNLVSNTADLLIISHKTFIPSFTKNVLPINTNFVAQRQSQGLNVSIVDVDDVYDEFSFGEHGPQAIRDFLSYASTHWATIPRYVIFTGDATLDPRDYSQLGSFDLVPTKLVDTTFNETAADDWLTDFDNDQIADIPVGRLPVRTVAEADKVIEKIVNFAPANVPQEALLVADDPTNYFFNFETANDRVDDLLPSSMPVSKIYRRLEVKTLTGNISTNSASTSVSGTGTLFSSELSVGAVIHKSTGGEPLGIVASISSNTSLTLVSSAAESFSGSYGKQDNATAHANVIARLNEGKALVNYSGHGNVNVWTGAPIFTTNDALVLTNGNKLSFVVVMDCLNGYFQGQALVSISEALLMAPNGGAVAAFASSGLTFPDGQHEMSEQLYTLIYGSQPIAMGDAIKIAKGFTNDLDVRKTWIFFGDPSMKIR